MHVVLGVCGGIAAYKAAELLRLMQQDAMDVEVVMTSAAQQFVTPLTFAALSGHRVITGLWGDEAAAPNVDAAIEHIAVAQRASALVVAPCTADMLAKFAHGMADDFLSTLYLATAAPVIVAPAMNVNMWQHPATQKNLQMLRERGVHIVEPGAGYLACGMVGAGRMAGPAEVASAVRNVLMRREDMRGQTVLVSAGGTREALDPVRFLGNRSSGKMGIAIANAAAARGARVLLVCANSSIAASAGVERTDVTDAAGMRDAMLRLLPQASMVVMAAAVSDFRPATVANEKIKRNGAWTITLEPTEDILASITSQRPEGCRVIGFAAETSDVLENARGKLHRKGLDAIFANDVSTIGSGFDVDDNSGTWISTDAVTEIPRMSKRSLADRILDEALALRAPVAERTA